MPYRMPIHGTANAPKFDGTTDNLTEFIDAYEQLADEAGLQGLNRIKGIIRYLECDDRELWGGMPEVQVSNYDAFLDEVKQLHEKLQTLGHFFEPLYLRAFRKVMQPLIDEDRIGKAEHDHLFMEGIPSDAQAQIRLCLMIKFPDHHPYNPYPFMDVFAAAQFLLPAHTFPAPSAPAIQTYYYERIDSDSEKSDKEAEPDVEDEPVVTVEERKALARPQTALSYKKECNEWDVAQKLFKQEIDDFNKAERVRKELDDSIKHRMGHAREWFKKMTAKQEKEKDNLKKKLEEISEELCRTMGCRVVMLVSHKKKTDKSLAVTLHESKLQSVKKKFSVSSDSIKEWSSTDPTDKDQDDLEIDDSDKAEAEPELILDEEGYAKLPSRKGVALRGQQDLIRNIFFASYKVFTKTNRPVPWRQIVANAPHYLEATCVPETLVVRDPSHMRLEDVISLWHHWESQSLAKKKLVIFINAKKGDKMMKVADKEEKKRKTKDYVEVLSSDEVEKASAWMTTTLNWWTPLVIWQNPLNRCDWPSWAKWSWRHDYLPKDIHESRKMLEASLNKLRTANISNDTSAISVVLGLVGIIELHMRDRYLQNEEDENTEGKQEMEQEKDTEVVVVEEEEEEEEVEVKQTGKKRSRTQVPSRNSKRAKTEPKVSSNKFKKPVKAKPAM
ncbi:uncharacterized protein F5891DRAFT_1187625 [Suillus fuscotomentosus]|uniref:Uncharacterized protein n=1 Tax=Suillus fuscotomentosus TaxID=1912939 RepID=A0AAD4E861_9AGAM|nr:uncharacterized protein F5891DRAFT_1187625 [Suillus fuscotomentosus]KAG1901340.1 hypothetical protein F5891DRAFT_1187625 [Suillus fuscotomentosus]